MKCYDIYKRIFILFGIYHPQGAVMLKRRFSCFTVVLGFNILLSAHASAATDTFTIVALGDSITKAFNAEHYFGDSPEVSWSTGTKVTTGFLSHLERLQKVFPQKKVSGFNYAVTGAVVRDLDSQVKRANAKKPDYVTVIIGANDICRWSANYQGQLDEFTEHLKTTLDSLVTANPKVKITMSALPDVYRLWQLSKDTASCRKAWNFIGLCKGLLASDLSNAQRTAFKERWDHANSNMASVAAMFPQNIKFSDAVATYAFDKDQISSNDCFHPSTKGQSVLAQKTWEEGWFNTNNLASED